MLVVSSPDHCIHSWKMGVKPPGLRNRMTLVFMKVKGLGTGLKERAGLCMIAAATG